MYACFVTISLAFWLDADAERACMAWQRSLAFDWRELQLLNDFACLDNVSLQTYRSF